MAIAVTSEMIYPAGEHSVLIREEYTGHGGLRRAQYRMLERDSDFWEEPTVRYSEDNGRTWGPWGETDDTLYSEASDGSWEMIWMNRTPYCWNPVHRHTFGMMRHLIWPGGHHASYENYFKRGGKMTWDHVYLVVQPEGGGERSSTLVRYGPGSEFDPANPADSSYGESNHAYCYQAPVVTPEGDVLWALSVPMLDCLRMRDLNPSEVFPTRPEGMYGFVLVRGVWNGTGYSLVFSRPVVISDLQSSRGIDEPTVALLGSGRIVVVFRGSNCQFDWSRIEPGTPGYKWYCYSEDGGRTFTDPVPWHFDNGEVVYSSATISKFIRSSRNGKLYWIGNITDPTTISGNYPRWPLQIVEVDERYGVAKKETLTVIDTKRDWESDKVQLSNFSLLEDRETGDIEICLSKIGQYKESTWKAETWKYRVRVDS